MMRITGVDFESQSLEAAVTNVTEVGALTVDVDEAGRVFPIDRYSALIYDPSYPPQPELIVELTGITDAILQEKGVLPLEAFTRLKSMIGGSEIIFAHNKAFDQTIYNAQHKKLFGEDPPPAEWICTRSEINYPEKYKCKKLAHLAYDHGLKMDDRILHRAINDVELMMELVLQNYSLPEILKFARDPWVFIAADILPPWKDNGVGKDQAYKLGYNWEKPRGDYEPVFPKLWVKKVKGYQVAKEKELAPFRVSVLNSASTT